MFSFHLYHLIAIYLYNVMMCFSLSICLSQILGAINVINIVLYSF